MIAVFKRYDGDQFEPVLVYDGEAEEMWGLDRLWESSLDLVGLTEAEFAAFFPPPNFVAGEATNGDPFADIPNAEQYVRNYPPGSEEIPDVPTRTPRHVYLDDPTIRGGSEYDSSDHKDDE